MPSSSSGVSSSMSYPKVSCGFATTASLPTDTAQTSLSESDSCSDNNHSPWPPSLRPATLAKTQATTSCPIPASCVPTAKKADSASLLRSPSPVYHLGASILRELTDEDHAHDAHSTGELRAPDACRTLGDTEDSRRASDAGSERDPTGCLSPADPFPTPCPTVTISIATSVSGFVQRVVIRRGSTTSRVSNLVCAGYNTYVRRACNG